MGLDISLVKIEKKETDEVSWLLVEENPELEEKFSSYKLKRHFECPNESDYEDVYYYTEISYQRKGVVAAFYTTVQNDLCIVEKEEAEKLLPLMELERKEDFKTAFIDKFVTGETVILISW